MEERTGKTVRDVGTVYIIKDGKIREIEINPKIPFEDLQDMKFGMYFDDVELQFACKFLGISMDKARKLSVEELYAPLVDSGYTVIRKYAKARISDSYLENYIVLPENVSKTDIDIINRIWRKATVSATIGYNNIYNRTNYPYGRGYESIRKTPVIGPLEEKNEALNIFLREKTGELSEDEKQMLYTYRDFDLKRLLTTDEDVSKNIINNDNSCVYVITPNEAIGVTLRNVRHLWQVREVFANLYFDKYMDCDRDSLSLDEAKFYNSIIIEMSTTLGVPILPWMPRKINNFQYEKLVEFCNELSKIKSETGKNFDEVTFVDPKGEHHDAYISDFRKMLEDNKDLLVDDSIKSFEKVPFPTRTDITEQELDSFFGTNKERVAQQIKNELRVANPTALERGQDIINLTKGEEEKNK